VVVEEAAEGGDDLAAGDEDAADVVAGDEVEVALAVADLDVAEAVPFLGWGPEGFGDEQVLGGGDGDLSSAGAEDLSGDAEEVAGVEGGEAAVALLAEEVEAEEELEAAGAVVEVGEGGLAVAAESGEPAGDADLGSFQGGERGVDLGGEVGAVEAGDEEGVAAGGAKLG
jgi:hypothetical protein